MAEDDDKEQKTEYPTGKRLHEAREQGNLPVSREVGYWSSFLAILIVVTWLGPPMTQQLITILRVFLEAPHAFILDDHGLQTVVFTAIVQVAMVSGLIFLVLLFFIIAGFMAQTGLFASTSLIKPDVMRLSFISGLKRLVSMSSIVELVKSFGKLIVMGITAYFLLWPLVQILPGFTGQPLMASVVFLHKQAIHIIVVLLLVFTVIALGDLFYQRYSYIKNLRMTKQEVKDEFRQQDGDPIIKSRLRQIRMEKARKRMMANVPKADVIITNPTHYAVALKYESGKMSAPLVLAKGVDRVAERIRAIAEENKITLVSNPPLARALYDTVEIDKEIPSHLYRAVAEVISYVYKLKKIRG